MADPTDAQRKQWIAQWRSAATALERIRVDELGRVDLNRVADALEAASLAGAPVRARSADSGLVQQQRIFHRVRVG